MPPRRPTPEHQEAVSRRLALLSAELAGARSAPEDETDHEPDWTFAHTHVPVRSPPPEDEPPPTVPLPGRHASRRAGRMLAGLVPETLRGRAVLGPAQVAIVAVLVAIGLALTCWWLVRGDAREVEAPRLLTATATPLVAATAVPLAPSGSAPTSGGSVTVDVAGKVRDPGIAVLDAGSRVVDALAAAGGARAGVDLSGLNLARLLVDGEQIVVGVAPPPGVAASAVPSGAVTPGPLVNLNTASETDLETLPEVGPVTAQAIIAWRTEHGGFSAVDELLEVDGIGDTTLGRIAPYVTV